jgi:hypothetical protein
MKTKFGLLVVLLGLGAVHFAAAVAASQAMVLRVLDTMMSSDQLLLFWSVSTIATATESRRRSNQIHNIYIYIQDFCNAMT